MKIAKSITRLSEKSIVSASALALLLVLTSQQANAAATYSFYNITNNDITGGAVADGKANLKVEVIDLGSVNNVNQVQFKFTNTSSSSLTDIYFDDGTLLGISSIYDSGAGVSFSQDASPPNLPGGNTVTPPFVVTAGFLADSNPPVAGNGVSMNEWLAIDFNLINGKTYDDVLSALALPNNGLGPNDLRIGVHVQGFANNGSESFINIEGTVSPVPEADAWVMMVAGLGLVSFMARRKRYDAA